LVYGGPYSRRPGLGWRDRVPRRPPDYGGSTGVGGLSRGLPVGGGNGWYAADILWKIRGWIDQLVGGPGLRRGRRDPETVGYGEALDFWRVVGFERRPPPGLARRDEAAG